MCLSIYTLELLRETRGAEKEDWKYLTGVWKHVESREPRCSSPALLEFSGPYTLDGGVCFMWKIWLRKCNGESRGKWLRTQDFNTFLGISFSFASQCLSHNFFLPTFLFLSSNFHFYIFFSPLRVSSKEELEIVTINHLAFNWVLINIYGLRSHPSLKISGRVMKVYIILTLSPKLKYYSPGQITCQHYANVQLPNCKDRFLQCYRQLSFNHQQGSQVSTQCHNRIF